MWMNSQNVWSGSEDVLVCIVRMCRMSAIMKMHKKDV